jgi:uncharacterized protein (DUF952 family)
MTPKTGYKVLTTAQMKELEGGAFSGSPADIADGYIHLSTADQLVGTIEKHFAGEHDLWLVAVDLEAEGGRVKWESSRDDALFPHLYGTLLLETVVAYSPLEYEPDGALRLPVTG